VARLRSYPPLELGELRGDGFVGTFITFLMVRGGRIRLVGGGGGGGGGVGFCAGRGED